MKTKHTFSTTATYSVGSKEYSPRVPHNKVSWAKMQAAMPCTGEDLMKVLQTTPAAATKLAKEHEWKTAPVAAKGKPQKVSGFRTNHADMIGYLVGGDYIAVKQAKAS